MPPADESQLSSTTVEPQHPWLVMLYMAGDNDLTEDMVLMLQDLQAEGPPAGDTIVAQFDPSAEGLLTQRYVFTDSRGANGLHVKEARTETNTGNTETLNDFVKWAVNNYGGPNTRYLLILAGHGSGITEDFFLRDDTSKDSLTIDELAQGLAAANDVIKAKGGEKIDILGLDACYMAMGEVAYQIREHVGILIGAEGLEPAFGWPYRRILSAAKAYRSAPENKGQSMDPRRLAEAIVRQYVEHYLDYDIAVGRSADLAAIDLTRMGDLAQAVSALAESLIKAVHADQHDLVTLAHWYAQTYKADQFVDLRDFCDQTRKRFTSDDSAGVHAGVRAACDRVLRALDGDAQGNGRCIIRSGCTGFAHQHSYGISIYFPWAIVSQDYRGLDFAKDTRWDDFLACQVARTRRDSREREKVMVPPVPEPIDKDVEALDELQLHRLLQLRAGYRGTGGVDVSKLRRVDVRNLKQLVEKTDIAPGDRRRELHRRFLRGTGTRRSRYTGEGSRYTGEGSRYTGEGSRYPADRERSVKNLPVGSGMAFWPLHGGDTPTPSPVKKSVEEPDTSAKTPESVLTPQ